MSLVNASGAQSILRACAAYFVACGVSAIWFPVSWLWVSGLPTSVSNELGVAFGVIGAYMLALGAGAYIASKDPVRNSAVTLTLVIANAFDFLVTLKAVLQGGLPALNGSAFLVITVLWTTLLFLAWRARQIE
jgi:hypothetical protein